jgi:hypothetical protein
VVHILDDRCYLILGFDIQFIGLAISASVVLIDAIYYRPGNVSNSPLTQTLYYAEQGFPQAKGRQIRKRLQLQAYHPAI